MTNCRDIHERTPTRLSRTVGCMLGGAVGDALGAPVEFLDLPEIHRRYGRTGVPLYEEAYGCKGAFTDDTQLALFTVEGLILATIRDEYRRGDLVIQAIYHAYLRWLLTQEVHRQRQLISKHGTCAVIDGVLAGHREMFSRRAPDQACLTALRSEQMGSMDHPVNDSKGGGGLMRVAPIGLAFADAEKAFQLGCEAAAITHGHPTGFLCAGFLASVISRLVADDPLEGAISVAVRLLRKHNRHDECLHAVDRAVALAHSQKPSPEAIETLGAGWVAEEALAIGLYCAMVAGDDYRLGVLSAVNHSGGSDSTGSIAGAIVGAGNGVEVIPTEWLIHLEMKDLIQEMATDLFDRFIRQPPSPA